MQQPPLADQASWETYFQHLQCFQAFLDQLLYPSLLLLVPVLSEPIACSPFRILAEIISGELIPLSEKRAVLRIWSACAVERSVCGHNQASGATATRGIRPTRERTWYGISLLLACAKDMVTGVEDEWVAVWRLE